ncbi:hypothetical protein [Streptomyces anthocyanicus]|uniref:hypothetical protein n=1 Tax=Streptomyces anthocyanicus TaxID=68174 RepID=UPI00216AF3C4|nr:hypothetical protein [Streptomyces anthocyanicus]WTC49643.1 hypothetical protein OG855_18585 [Streptomyces anthocyanicus]
MAPEARKPCEDCGKVERLFHFGRCRRCAGERHLRRLLTPPDGRPRPELDQIAAALLDHNPRRALLYTRESKEAARLLNDLASGACALSHEALDARSAGHRRDLAVDWFRSVLVAAGLLPVRDEYLARLERWIDYKTAALDDPDHRQLITAYARWDRVARIRRRARGKPIAASAADITQVQISKAVLFLSWLISQGERLATCRQEHIDLWLTSEPHQGPYAAGPFVAWAVRSKFASGISIPTRAHRVSYRPLDADERWKIARQLLNDDSFETKDRVAGLMVLLYGQTPARTCRLTTAHVLHDEDGVALRINKTPLRLPPPPGRSCPATRRHRAQPRAHGEQQRAERTLAVPDPASRTSADQQSARDPSAEHRPPVRSRTMRRLARPLHTDAASRAATATRYQPHGGRTMVCRRGQNGLRSRGGPSIMSCTPSAAIRL